MFSSPPQRLVDASRAVDVTRVSRPILSRLTRSDKLRRMVRSIERTTIVRAPDRRRGRYHWPSWSSASAILWGVAGVPGGPRSAAGRLLGTRALRTGG